MINGIQLFRLPMGAFDSGPPEPPAPPKFYVAIASDPIEGRSMLVGIASTIEEAKSALQSQEVIQLGFELGYRIAMPYFRETAARDICEWLNRTGVVLSTASRIATEMAATLQEMSLTFPPGDQQCDCSDMSLSIEVIPSFNLSLDTQSPSAEPGQSEAT